MCQSSRSRGRHVAFAAGDEIPRHVAGPISGKRGVARMRLRVAPGDYQSDDKQVRDRKMTIDVHGGGRERRSSLEPEHRSLFFSLSLSLSVRLSHSLILFLSRDSFNPYLPNGRPVRVIICNAAIVFRRGLKMSTREVGRALIARRDGKGGFISLSTRRED